MQMCLCPLYGQRLGAEDSSRLSWRQCSLTPARAKGIRRPCCAVQAMGEHHHVGCIPNETMPHWHEAFWTDDLLLHAAKPGGEKQPLESRVLAGLLNASSVPYRQASKGAPATQSGLRHMNTRRHASLSSRDKGPMHALHSAVQPPNPVHRHHTGRMRMDARREASLPSCGMGQLHALHFAVQLCTCLMSAQRSCDEQVLAAICTILALLPACGLEQSGHPCLLQHCKHQRECQGLYARFGCPGS